MVIFKNNIYNITFKFIYTFINLNIYITYIKLY